MNRHQFFALYALLLATQQPRELTFVAGVLGLLSIVAFILSLQEEPKP